MVAFASRPDADAAVALAYERVLLRPPDAQAAAYGALLATGDLDPIALTASLRGSFEHTAIVAPLRARVRAAYRLLFDRESRPGEERAHVGAFRAQLPADQQVLERLAGPRADDLLGIRPLNLEMDVTNQCNLRCVMCYFSDPAVGRRERKDMTVEQYHRIAEQTFAWTQRVCFGFGTEPTLHPELGAFVQLAKARGVPKVYCNTNGLRLKPALAEMLIDARMDALNVSLDAGTAASYERVRRGARWQVVIENLRWLQGRKARLSLTTPHLSLSFVLMRSTIGELCDFVCVAADLGADAIHLIHLVPYAELDLVAESLHGHAAAADRAVREAVELAARLGVRTRVPDAMTAPGGGEAAPPRLDQARARHNYDLRLGPDDEARGCCPFPWHFLGIDASGSVLPCGWWHTGERMGSLFTDDFATIWHGEAWRRLRQDLVAGVLARDCQRCPASGMGSARHGESFVARQHAPSAPAERAAGAR